MNFILIQVDTLKQKPLPKDYFKRKKFKNLIDIRQYTEQISNQLNLEGYLTHHIDILKKNDSLYNGFISLNSKTSEIRLLFDSNIKLPQWIKNKSKLIEFPQLTQTINELYTFYENLGYSFTEIELKNISTKENQLVANVSINLPYQRHIDKIVLKGYNNFPHKYIKHYLHLKPNSTFNKQTINATSTALSSLNFITETRKPEVLFTKDSTQLYLYLKRKNSNKFDGLIGFTNSENGKLQFNGYLDIELNNSFNYGEQLAFFWSNNGNEQEHFKLKTKTPYIFNTPISPSINFEIYKQDSTFVNIDLIIDFDYSLNRSHTIGVTYLSENSSNLLENNSNNLVESFSKNLYGVLYRYNNLLHKKTIFTIDSALRLGIKNSQNTSSQQYYLYLDLSLSEALTRKSSIYLRNRTEFLKGNELLLNELFQIGGANTIRGFYEQSIFSSSYNFTNLEYRLLTSNESYIYTFTDFAITENNDTDIFDRLYSFGLGYAYKTKGGFINLNYAFGKTNKNPFDFNQGIFHIKLTSWF
ncbi:POTRA domain-containing protein [Flavicella sp.]|uniref:POTRA domain-containing protein n=1 Tax=Flavicella sp. TaxID=2957742 RepID=UPI00301AA1EC